MVYYKVGNRITDYPLARTVCGRTTLHCLTRAEDEALVVFYRMTQFSSYDFNSLAEATTFRNIRLIFCCSGANWHDWRRKIAESGQESSNHYLLEDSYHQSSWILVRSGIIIRNYGSIVGHYIPRLPNAFMRGRFDELEHRVRDRLDELEHKNQELEQKSMQERTRYRVVIEDLRLDMNNLRNEVATLKEDVMGRQKKMMDEFDHRQDRLDEFGNRQDRLDELENKNEAKNMQDHAQYEKKLTVLENSTSDIVDLRLQMKDLRNELTELQAEKKKKKKGRVKAVKAFLTRKAGEAAMDAVMDEAGDSVMDALSGLGEMLGG